MTRPAADKPRPSAGQKEDADTERVLRIIDANSNRAREGARVVEEVARFVLSDGGLSGRWKDVRHSVSNFSDALEKRAVDFRDSANDPGRELLSSGESARVDYTSIVRANAKRAQEGIRALEEFSKLLCPAVSVKFKRLRFEAYTLEKDTLSALARRNEKKESDEYN